MKPTIPLTDAQKKIVEDNLGLVGSLSIKWNNWHKSISKEDFFQAGFFGLANAAVHFDPRRGVAFSTYAHHCIFNVMRRYVDKSKKLSRFPPQQYMDAQTRKWKDESRGDVPLEKLRGAMDELPQFERDLIYRHFFERKTYTEISKNEGVTTQAISRRAKIILEKIKLRMRNERE